jgi:uncharacterized membrane protein YidH (DUF202 family)
VTGRAPGDGLFDPGLQPERTALAWRRAGLALGVASLVLARVLAETSPPLAFLGGGGGVVVAIVVLVVAERRYRSHHRRLTAAAGARIPLASGGLPALAAVTTGLLGVGAAVAVILFAVLK